MKIFQLRLQGVLALTFCLASASDVKRQLSFADVGSYHTIFDARPTPFIAIARADTQSPPVTSVGIAKPAAAPFQALASSPVHDFNLQSVPHAVFLTPVAAKGVALDQGWHGFETAPLQFSPSFSHKALVPVHDAPFELAPVLHNYEIPSQVHVTNFGQNHVAANFNKHLNAPLPQYQTFQGDIQPFHTMFHAPSGFSSPIQLDSQIVQPVKPSHSLPPSGHGVISTPAPLLSSPAYESQGPSQASDHASKGYSPLEAGFQGSHYFPPTGHSSSLSTHGSLGSKNGGFRHGHRQALKHQSHGHKHHSNSISSFGASGGGSSSSFHTPSSTRHTAPSGYGQSTFNSPGHGNKAYSHGSDSIGSLYSSHRPASSHTAFGTTGLSSSHNPSDSQSSISHGGDSTDHGSSNSGDKATSFQSFVIHSYKAAPVHSKKADYRHQDPSSDKRPYYSSFFGNSKELHDDRSY